MKRVSFFIFLFIFIASIYGEALPVRIGIEGSASFLNELKDKFSLSYELVAISKSEMNIILEILKQEDVGIREGKKGEYKLPAVDYVLVVSSDSVRFIDMRRLVDSFLNLKNAKKIDPVSFIVNYFENYVLYFDLPCFIDKKARKGSYYVLMNKDFEDVGYVRFMGDTNKVCFYSKKASYARRLRPAVIRNGKVLYELKHKDSTIAIFGELFRVFRDGEEVLLQVLVEKGGFLNVVDIYGDEIYVVSSEPVEKGIHNFTFQAYKGPKVTTETLVFFLTYKPLESLKDFNELCDILRSSPGVAIMSFVVK